MGGLELVVTGVVVSQRRRRRGGCLTTGRSGRSRQSRGRNVVRARDPPDGSG